VRTQLKRQSSRIHFCLCFDLALRLVLGFALALGLTRSGSLAPPVDRFHSSKVSLEILPVTKSSANFLRWALLLNGMSSGGLDVASPWKSAPRKGYVAAQQWPTSSLLCL
jgi:hypothetical protein